MVLRPTATTRVCRTCEDSLLLSSPVDEGSCLDRGPCRLTFLSSFDSNSNLLSIHFLLTKFFYKLQSPSSFPSLTSRWTETHGPRVGSSRSRRHVPGVRVVESHKCCLTGWGMEKFVEKFVRVFCCRFLFHSFRSGLSRPFHS